MVEKNEETYVSFKWMLAQTLALIVSIVTIGILIVTAVNSKIDTGLLTKVSIEKFEERTKLLEDYCLKDEKGKSKMVDNRYEFDSDEKRVEAMRAVNELLEEEVEIGIDKIKIEIDQLQDAISADEMVILEPFVDFIEEGKKDV
jgi:hypothetical protein